MQLKDIIYDGQKFSDYGLLTVFVSMSEETTPDVGNKLEFTKVKPYESDVYNVVDAQYSDVLSLQFEVSKINCEHINDYIFSGKEMNEIMMWLNRKGLHKIQFIYENDEFADTFFMGSFTELHPLLVGDKPVGFNCTFTTNAPFGFHEPVSVTNYKIKTDENGNIVKDSNGNTQTDTVKDFKVNSISMEEGFLYCNATIKLKEAGNFVLTNEDDNNPVVVNNCIKDEVLTFTGWNNVKDIKSSVAHKKLYNDFNFNFPRIINKYGNPHNHFKSNLDAEIKMTYIPVVKIGEII